MVEGTPAAVDCLHHQRKGIAIAGDADSARGASSLVIASRLVKTVNRMTPGEVAKFGFSERDRKLTIPVDDGKINIRAPAEQAVCFAESASRSAIRPRLTRVVTMCRPSSADIRPMPSRPAKEQDRRDLRQIAPGSE
jgi:hypothetical protein